MGSASIDCEDPAEYRGIRSVDSQGSVPSAPRRNFVFRRRERNLTGEMFTVRQRIERIGLDLICGSCRQQIRKSERLPILCHFYPRNQARGMCPLTRCYVRCTNCPNGIVLGRNIGTPNNFAVLAGAIQQLPPDNSEANIEDEAYPDALLDSPNDYQTPYVTNCEWEKFRGSDLVF